MYIPYLLLIQHRVWLPENRNGMSFEAGRRLRGVFYTTRWREGRTCDQWGSLTTSRREGGEEKRMFSKIGTLSVCTLFEWCTHAHAHMGAHSGCHTSNGAHTKAHMKSATCACSLFEWCSHALTHAHMNAHSGVCFMAWRPPSAEPG